MHAIKIIMAACLLLALPCQAANAQAQKEISQLLNYIAQSDCQFVRNGEVYDGKKAVEHFQMKLEKAGDRIQQTEQFIEHIASKTYFGNKPYLVRCPKQVEQQSGPWLKAELARLRKG